MSSTTGSVGGDVGVHLLKDSERGLGAAYVLGITQAMATLDADVVVQMDADFSHDLEDAGRLRARVATDTDVAIGSRYVAGGDVDESWGFRRRQLSLWGNQMVLDCRVERGADLFVDIETDRFWWWDGAALTASLLVASAALFVFLTARRLVRPAPALLVAIAFALGSCAWPVSSQALWQHPAATFCLSLGAWFLVRSETRRGAAAWCGAAFGMAVLCRPTTAVVVLCAGVYLLLVDRRRCAAYVLGGLPFAAALAAYHSFYFGNPLVFGQTAVAGSVALWKTGSAEIWQSSWLESLPGLLISPARGLLWFSPVLILGLAGAVQVWREPRYRNPDTPASGRRARDPGCRQVVRLVGRIDLGLPLHRRHHAVSRPAVDPRDRAADRGPHHEGLVRRPARVVRRRSVHRRVQLQPARLERPVARSRAPRVCEPVALGPAPDRLPPRQFQLRAGQEKAGDGHLPELPRPDPQRARPQSKHVSMTAAHRSLPPP